MTQAIRTNATEAETRHGITEEFRIWNNDAQRDGEGEIITAYDFPPPRKVGALEATCRFQLRGVPLSVSCLEQAHLSSELAGRLPGHLGYEDEREAWHCRYDAASIPPA